VPAPTAVTSSNGGRAARVRAAFASRLVALTALVTLGFANEAWAQSWTTTGSLPAFAEQAATLLMNNQVLIAGVAEIYNPSTGTWSSTGALATARVAGRHARHVIVTSNPARRLQNFTRLECGTFFRS
jgi:hypothetical protein